MATVFNGNRVHFLEKKMNYVRVDDVSNIWESKGWKITQADAERLVDGAIYLHKSKTSSSFLGGLISSYRVESEGELTGRTTFTFEFELKFKDVRAGNAGWGMDKKLVFPEKKS